MEFIEQKLLIDVRDQRRIARLLQPYRKATLTQITTWYSHVPLMLAKRRKLRVFTWPHQNWMVEDWKNIAWSDESQFLLRRSDGVVRICPK